MANKNNTMLEQFQNLIDKSYNKQTQNKHP